MEEENKKISCFVLWSKLKIKIHFSSRKVYFDEREIWWASLGANIGHEQDGKNKMFERPVLIIKKFNHDIFWAIPITSKNKTGKYYHQIKYQGENYAVILSQLKLMSSKRLWRKIRMITKKEFNEIRLRLIKDIL